MQNNPSGTFDRVDFNECVVKAIAKCEIDLSSELNKWRAAYEAWEQAGSIPALRPKCKLVLDAFQQDFVDKANAVEERAKARSKRKRENISIENTFSGKGFTKEQDL